MYQNKFGIVTKGKKPQKKNENSIVTPSNRDGSVVVDQNYARSVAYGFQMDTDAKFNNETELIHKYRQISQYPEVENAIEDIVNEAIVYDDNELYPVKLNLNNVKISSGIKEQIVEEFDNILDLFDAQKLDEDFKTWYVDGRTHYFIDIDIENQQDGINEIRYIEPFKIKKIKEIKRTKNAEGIDVIEDIDEYYLFNDMGINENSTSGIRISKESIIYSCSGLMDSASGNILSYIHKAIKPANQLRMLEDATVIYRVSRAPERRVFYIDVGNLPKIKAEQYVQDTISRFTNKIVYNATTGELNNSTKQLSMLEDFYMPRREGGKGTEITTLPSGQNLGELGDVMYFQNKLYKSLNVPQSRFQSDGGFNLGRASEISRDEVKFAKFINKLRRKFSSVFLEALRIQLIAKKIINVDEWDTIQKNAIINFAEDNYFSELKQNEIFNNRIQTLNNIDTYVGKYFSEEWVKKNVLMQDDTEISEIKKQIDKEKPIEDEESNTDDGKEQDFKLPEPPEHNDPKNLDKTEKENNE